MLPWPKVQQNNTKAKTTVNTRRGPRCKHKQTGKIGDKIGHTQTTDGDLRNNPITEADKKARQHTHTHVHKQTTHIVQPVPHNIDTTRNTHNTHNMRRNTRRPNHDTTYIQTTHVQTHNIQNTQNTQQATVDSQHAARNTQHIAQQQLTKGSTTHRSRRAMDVAA